MKRPPNCLNLGGDGDDVQVVVGVEKAFAIKLSDSEASGCETVGQLYEIVASKLPVSEARGLRCPTTVAFFRLRAALRRLGVAGRITSRTDLRALALGHDLKHLHRALSRESGLTLPDLVSRAYGAGILALMLATSVILAVGLGFWLMLLAGIASTIVVGLLLPWTIPSEISMLGAFAAASVSWNYGALAVECGGARPDELWKALVDVVRLSSGTGFQGEINRDTRFFPR